MKSIAYLILMLLALGLLNCEVANSATASLQTGLISRDESQNRILLASVYSLDKCMNQMHTTDFIQINIYSNLLGCSDTCSASTYYKESDVNSLYTGIILAPCDSDAYLTLPKVEPYSAKKFQLNYMGF